MKKKKSELAVRQARKGYGFIGLWLFGIIFLFGIPIIQSMIYSFSDVGIEVGYVDVQFVGLENYKKLLFKNTEYIPAFFPTIGNVLIETPMIIFFSLFMAIMLNQKFKGRIFFRAVFFLPVIIAGGVVMNIITNDSYSTSIVSGARSSMMFQSVGVEQLLGNLNLNSTITELIIEYVNGIFNLAWRSGIQMLIFLAALQSVPPQLYEVCKVEGANSWETFWKVTFPMISSMVLVNVTYTLVDLFGDYSNEILQMITSASEKSQVGNASAMAWLYFMVSFIIIIVTYFLINRKVCWMD
ncbi:MAG: sugar ABC transporter permease [Clostridia bacterium]|nr:sugar ABC transporter permease [Clostridia bacterium]